MARWARALRVADPTFYRAPAAFSAPDLWGTGAAARRTSNPTRTKLAGGKVDSKRLVLTLGQRNLRSTFSTTTRYSHETAPALFLNWSLMTYGRMGLFRRMRAGYTQAAALEYIAPALGVACRAVHAAQGFKRLAAQFPASCRATAMRFEIERAPTVSAHRTEKVAACWRFAIRP